MPVRTPVRFRRRSPDVRVELTPLIDVVFLLLTFFVFALVLMVRVDAIDVNLPELTGAADAPSGTLVTVAVTKAGDIRVDGEPTTIDDLADAASRALESAGSANTEPRLVLAIDAEAPAGTLIRVGGELARSGLGGFSLVGTEAAPAQPIPQPTAPTP